MSNSEISIEEFPINETVDAVLNIMEAAGVSAPRILIVATDCYGKVVSTSNLDHESQLGLLQFVINAILAGSAKAFPPEVTGTKQ